MRDAGKSSSSIKPAKEIGELKSFSSPFTRTFIVDKKAQKNKKHKTATSQLRSDSCAFCSFVPFVYYSAGWMMRRSSAACSFVTARTRTAARPDVNCGISVVRLATPSLSVFNVKISGRNVVPSTFTDTDTFASGFSLPLRRLLTKTRNVYRCPE